MTDDHEELQGRALLTPGVNPKWKAARIKRALGIEEGEGDE